MLYFNLILQNKNMKLFCEEMVRNFLPAIRSLLAKRLLEDYNLTQKQAADLLGLTQPAISQYIRESRGIKVRMVERKENIMKLIDNLAEDLVSKTLSERDLQSRFCRICKALRKNY